MLVCLFLRFTVIGVFALFLATPARSHEKPSPCGPSAHNIPQRSVNARGASAFLDAVAGMSEPERDQAIRGELMAGNLPDFLRNVQPVSLNTLLPSGDPVRLTLCVMADYLSIGSGDDFVLMPMGLNTALAVATQLGFTLPTRRMVNLIYRQSPVHMIPQPLPAGDSMRSTDYYRRHNALVSQQRALMGASPDVLTAGHKKDLVLSPRLWSQPGRVAIYGWHRSVDAPIQPLSTVHGARYADYSHGIRLVSTVVFVNDMPRSIFDVLADRQLAPLLSDEGLLPNLAEWVDRTVSTESGT